ncbi:hypothetical protein [Pseudomonas aeruginosa]|uniref:hypothetical protein n=1 Tax=Pseudomonas aeruginosa TaxID=287 RepID=UPI001F44EBE8|nr:hypothetical protein [Pseudomonas aeruginosa]
MTVLNPILQIERTELLLEIERGVALLLFERHGLDKAKAEDIARHYVEELAFMYAGENFTIPMDYIYRRAMIAQFCLRSSMAPILSNYLENSGFVLIPFTTSSKGSRGVRI